MPIDFETGTARFRREKGGPRTQDIQINFASPVRKARVAISGYDVAFLDSKEFDKPIHRLIVTGEVLDVRGTTVIARVSLGLRDASGSFDDAYTGSVDVTAIVDRD